MPRSIVLSDSLKSPPMAILKCGEHFVVTALLSSIKLPSTRYIGHPNRSSPFLSLANKIVQDLQRCQTHFLSSDTVPYHQKMRYLRLGQSLNTVPQDRKLQYQEECHLNYESMKPVCWPSLIRGGIRPLPPAGIGGPALIYGGDLTKGQFHLHFSRSPTSSIAYAQCSASESYST